MILEEDIIKQMKVLLLMIPKEDKSDPRRRHNKTDESSTFNDPKRRQI